MLGIRRIQAQLGLRSYLVPPGIKTCLYRSSLQHLESKLHVTLNGYCIRYLGINIVHFMKQLLDHNRMQNKY